MAVSFGQCISFPFSKFVHFQHVKTNDKNCKEISIKLSLNWWFKEEEKSTNKNRTNRQSVQMQKEMIWRKTKSYFWQGKNEYACVSVSKILSFVKYVRFNCHSAFIFHHTTHTSTHCCYVMFLRLSFCVCMLMRVYVKGEKEDTVKYYISFRLLLVNSAWLLLLFKLNYTNELIAVYVHWAPNHLFNGISSVLSFIMIGLVDSNLK